MKDNENDEKYRTMFYHEKDRKKAGIMKMIEKQ